jgi:hypothetical protein
MEPNIHNNDKAENGGEVEAAKPKSWADEDLQRDAMQRGRDLGGE